MAGVYFIQQISSRLSVIQYTAVHELISVWFVSARQALCIGLEAFGEYSVVWAAFFLLALRFIFLGFWVFFYIKNRGVRALT